MAYLRTNFILFVFFVVLMIIRSGFADVQQCGPNEEYSNCGTHCPHTCADRNSPGKICDHMCVVGCFCSNGYVRQTDKDSPCIKETEC